MMKWEYAVRSVDENDEKQQEYLDSCGEEGWELVSVSGTTMYLKRELGDSR